MLPIFLLRTQPSNNGSSFLEAIRQNPFFQASQVSATRSSGPNGSLDGWNTIAWFGRSGFVFGCWVLGHWDDLSVKVGSLYFQSPVLHGSVFHWPGCSSRISHTACHLALVKSWRIHFWKIWFFGILKFLAGLVFLYLESWPKKHSMDRIHNFPKLRILKAMEQVLGQRSWS